MDMVTLCVGGATLAQAGFKAATHYMASKKMEKIKDTGKLFRVLVERDAKCAPSVMQDFWEKISGLFDPKNQTNYISFEVHATCAGISYYIWAQKELESFLQRTVNSVHPAAELEIEIFDYAAPTRFYCQPVKCATLSLEQDFVFNTLQVSGEKYLADPVSSLCAALTGLVGDDEVILQFVVRPVHYRIKNIAELNYKNYVQFGAKQSVMTGALKDALDYLPLYKGLCKGLRTAFYQAGANMPGLMGASGGVEKKVREDIPSMRLKANATCLFDTTVRILCAGSNSVRNHNNMRTAVSAFSVLVDKNRFSVERHKLVRHFLYDMYGRVCPVEVSNNLFSPAELAAFLHYPDGSVPYIKRLRAKKMPVPEGIASYNTLCDVREDNAILYGVSSFRGVTKYLAIKDLKMLMRHMYLTGTTGSGKTTLMMTIAKEIEDLCGYTFFDVKGDAALDLIARISPKNRDRLVYLDLAGNFYYPFNIMKIAGLTGYSLANMLVNVFVTAFGESTIQYHSQNVLRQAILAVDACDPDGSLLEVYRMMTDEQYMSMILERLEATRLHEVLAYWRRYKAMKEAARRKEKDAIENKLQHIVQNERPRRWLCQKENGIDFRKFMDERKIVIINLNQDNGDDIVKFFGTLFCTFIRRALFSRKDITDKYARVPHVLFVDEFEEFNAQDSEFKTMLSMARSYGMGLVLAHQAVDQLKPDMLGHVVDITLTQITLNVGDKSAKHMNEMYPGFLPQDLTSLQKYEAVGRLKDISHNAFSFTTIDFERCYASNGMKYVDSILAEQYAKYYKGASEIEDEIDERYRGVRTTPTAPNEVPSVQAKNASGHIAPKPKGATA